MLRWANWTTLLVFFLAALWISNWYHEDALQWRFVVPLLFLACLNGLIKRLLKRWSITPSRTTNRNSLDASAAGGGAFVSERRLDSHGVVTALILFAIAVVAYQVFGTRLSSVILGPRLATAAEIIASVKSGDSQEWFELTEQPEPVLTTQFPINVKGQIRIITYHLMQAPSAPELPIGTAEANSTAPFDVWTCNLAKIADDYGRGVSAALKQANLPMLEPFMLCEAESTRTVTRLSAVYFVLWFLMVAIAGARWLTSGLMR